MMSWLRASARFDRLRALFSVVALIVLLAPLAGCSAFNKDEDFVPDDPADKLYNEGLYLLNTKQDYKAAAKKFDEVDRQNPYSDWARKSLIMSAYSYYEAQEYDDCINSSKRYVTLHPGSPDAAYAQYLIGSSYYDQILDVTRDQQRAEKAISALDEVARKYPDTEYAVSAKKKVEMARDQLAGKEMEIGRFYMKRRDFTGAINRFKVVVTQYQTTRHVEEALMRLDRSLCLARHHQRGADRRGGARPQLPRQPLVQGRLHSGEDRRRRADREQGFLDQPRLQEDGLRLRSRRI